MQHLMSQNLDSNCSQEQGHGLVQPIETGYGEG